MNRIVLGMSHFQMWIGEEEEEGTGRGLFRL